MSLNNTLVSLKITLVSLNNAQFSNSGVEYNSQSNQVSNFKIEQAGSARPI